MDWEVGEKVEWVHISKRGSTVSLTKVNGYIREIDGENICCRRGKGKKDYWLKSENLQKLGSCDLRKFVAAMAWQGMK